MGEIEQRHEALVVRDLQVGLEAEAVSARAHAAHLQAKLDVAQTRLGRKNARIKQLVAQVEQLRAAAGDAGAGPLRRSLTRVTRRR